MAKKFNVLRGAMSPKAQQRSLAKAEQMLAEIHLNEEREVCGSAQADKPIMAITARNITLHNIHYAYYTNG
jgi:hypothetical protein